MKFLFAFLFFGFITLSLADIPVDKVSRLIQGSKTDPQPDYSDDKTAAYRKQIRGYGYKDTNNIYCKIYRICGGYSKGTLALSMLQAWRALGMLSNTNYGPHPNFPRAKVAHVIKSWQPGSSMAGIQAPQMSSK